MKKRLLSLLLALFLISVPALAAENSTDNFTAAKNLLRPVLRSAGGPYLYENVAALYEYGLSVGQADGTYGLTVPP